jgi:uncharacterized protein YijF (DUF1287 family)
MRVFVFIVILAFWAFLAFAARTTSADAEPLGLHDRGIFSDLDAKVELPVPAVTGRGRVVVDPRHGVAVLWDGDRPVKAYPLAGPVLAEQALAGLRPLDGAELAALGVSDGDVRVLATRERISGGDADDDGIPDELDIVLGAHKVVLNGAAYVSGYIDIPFPDGDVARATGVCTDVIVRALRNAGIDLQKELFDDVERAPAAYPMVRRRNPSIDQRRVRTLLPWFQRHFTAHGADPKSTTDPYRAGDILFMDTDPGREGPEHVGIVSDRRGLSGQWLVVNNWTVGYHESEMDLLPFVPVLYRFRAGTSP